MGKRPILTPSTIYRLYEAALKNVFNKLGNLTYHSTQQSV